MLPCKKSNLQYAAPWSPGGTGFRLPGNLSLQKTGQGFYHIRRGEAILAPGCGTVVSPPPHGSRRHRRRPPAAAGPVPKGKPGAPPVHRRCRLWPCRDCRYGFHIPGFRRSPPSGDPSGAPPPPSLSQGPCGGHPVRPHSASQAAELSIVGREHRGSLPHIPHIRRSLQHIQPIGVQNHRAPGLLQHRFHHRPNPRRPAQSRPTRQASQSCNRRITSGTAAGDRPPPSAARGNTTGSSSFTASMA